MRRYKEENRLKKAAEGTRELEQGVHLGERALVIDSITETAQNGDYRKLAGIFDAAMKEWGILPEGTGYVDGKFISDTGENLLSIRIMPVIRYTPLTAVTSAARRRKR